MGEVGGGGGGCNRTAAAAAAASADQLARPKKSEVPASYM